MVLQMHSRLVVIPSPGDKRFFGEEENFYYPQQPFEVRNKLDGVAKHMSSRQIQPHGNDVLMGRGGKNNQHSGNEKLREMARLESENYRSASKKGKSYISRQLVQQMRDLKPTAR
jgi:hypothetical protein